MFDVSKKENIDRVWDIIEKVSVCMLTTQSSVDCVRDRSKQGPTATLA
jgi:hypothetical protein